MSAEESSHNSDWALITQDGELFGESEDDASCSGSSIELLTSEDEGDSSHGIENSETRRGENSGAFFVLRLRSKELLTESDSDDKEDVSNKQPSKSDESEPELLLPVSSETSSNTGTDLVNKESGDIILKSQFEHGRIEENDESNDPVSSAEDGYTVNKKNADSSLSLSSVPVKSFETNLNGEDNISFPSSSAGSTSSEESLLEMLDPEISDKGQTETQHISLPADEVHGDEQDNFPVISLSCSNDESEIHDNKSTSSLTSSNFSLLDQNEAIENEDHDLIGNIQPDTEEDSHYPIVDDVLNNRTINHDVGNVDLPVVGEDDNDGQLRETEAPRPVVQQPKQDVYHITTIGLLEVICFFIVGFSCFCLGYIQVDYSSVVCCHDLQTMQQEAKNLVNHIDSFTQKSVIENGFDLDNWKKDTKLPEGKASSFHIKEFIALCNILQQYTAGMIHHVNGFQTKYNTKKEKFQQEFSALKSELDKVKNKNADLHKEFIEQGKRKYLLRELEDENVALFKRIGDLESQLMEAQDQSYSLQVQISALEKKTASRLSNDKNVVNSLQNKINQLEEEKEKIDEEFVVLENKIIHLEVENRKMDQYALQIDGCRREMMEIMSDRGRLAVKVDALKEELESAKNQKSELEQEVQKLQKELNETEMQNSKGTSEADYQNEKISDHMDSDEDEGIDVMSSDEDEGIDVMSSDDSYSNDQAKLKEKPDKWTFGQIKSKKQSKKTNNKRSSESDSGRKSWSDAMNDILNKTRSSMANVNKQIQDTLYQVKNLSEELWKKHEPSVNNILTSTYETVKENVHHVTNKVAKAAQKIVRKSSKWIKKYKKNLEKKKQRNQKQNKGMDEETVAGSTSRRRHKDPDGDDEDYNSQYYDDSSKMNNYPGYLKNEFQDLKISVEYVNTLNNFKCSELVDIMEDFQNFRKSEGVNVLSSNEKIWFLCHKAWFENMAYSDPTVDVECRDLIGHRQQAAVDHACCPCIGQYGRSKGKFCNLDNGCGQIRLKEKTSKKRKNHGNKVKKDMYNDLDIDKTKRENNETMEEETASSHGQFIYCDPFSQDLDCGDESWYLKRMKDREHLRKYRTSSKSEWLFKRAEERDYQRTQPDDWFFNRMGGQSYEAHQDDNWYRYNEEDNAFNAKEKDWL